MEIRSTNRLVEARNEENRTVGGYAAVFNSQSSDLGYFREIIAPGAFMESRDEGWPGVLARYNHDDNYLLGTSDAGTLRLSIDDTGLVYETDIPATRSDVYELIRRGDVRQSSFAFAIRGEDGDVWEERDGQIIRTVLRATLYDVAPVNRPAYPAATVGLRSLAASKHAPIEDVEALAKNGELSKLFKVTTKQPVRMTGVEAILSILDIA